MATETITVHSLSMKCVEDESCVPPGFPSYLTGPKIWDTAAYTENPDLYVCNLNEEDNMYIEEALRHFKDLNLARGFISRETFPLPETLSNKLKAISNSVYQGRGFEVLRGLKPEKYDEEENLLVFAGVTSHVAPKRSHTIGHIYDATKDKSLKGTLAPPAMPIAMAFHCDLDGGDIVAMYAQELAAEGGEHVLCSFWQVYNDMVAANSSALRVLAEPFPFELIDKSTDKPYHISRPIMTVSQSRVLVHFVKTLLTGSLYVPRSNSAPPLTEAQSFAVQDLITALNSRPLPLTQVRGDVVFINNMAVLHARNAFVDRENATRHILRLYLADPELSWEDSTVDTSSAKKVCSDMHIGPMSQRYETKSEIRAKGFFSPQCHHD